MKHFFVLAILSSITLTVFSQERESRKGHLFLKIGPEYRITPIYNDGPPAIQTYFTSIDSQNSGFALNYSFDYFITRDLSVGFTHGFRYAMLNTDLYHPENFGVVETKYRLMMDYHLYLDYHFKVFKKNELFVRFGISGLNRNSNFEIKESFGDGGSAYSSYDYAFEATNIGLGYKTGKLEGMLGVYTTKNSDLFDADGIRFTITYIKLNFNLFKF